MIKYNVFGSISSTDYDLAVLVDSIPSTPDAHELCKKFNSLLSEKFHDKKMNCNLVVSNSEIITDCFKGTVDELNNVILDTYELHTQNYACFVSKRLKRDVELKISRCLRGLLTMYSRTHLRKDIKEAIRGNIGDQIEVLSKIDFETLIPFGKKESMEDIYKMFAFQLGQTFGLFEGHELYTKESISIEYPELEEFLLRKKNTNNYIFNDYAQCLIQIIKSKYSHILDKNENVLTENS